MALALRRGSRHSDSRGDYYKRTRQTTVNGKVTMAGETVLSPSDFVIFACTDVPDGLYPGLVDVDPKAKTVMLNRTH